MSDKNSFINKVKNRQFAIDHSWRSGNGKKGSSYFAFDSVDEGVWNELSENLEAADENRYVNEYMPVDLAKVNDGKLKIFIKRAMHKIMKIFFGWYVFPLIDQQNRFNGKIYNAVSLESRLLADMQEQIERLSRSGNSQPEDAEKKAAQLSALADQLEKVNEGLAELTGRIDGKEEPQKAE